MIVVTGCAGFIGSHVCECLLELNIDVIGIDNLDPFYAEDIKRKNISTLLKSKKFTFLEANITSTETWNEVKKYNNIEGVIHLAAKAGVLPSLENPAAYIDTNIVGTQKVLDFLKETGIKKMVFASSSSVYGNNVKIPFSEDDRVDNPISPYAFTKKSNELQIHTWHHLYKIDVVCLRLFTVFGPRQRPDLAIRKFVQKIENDQAIEMYGDGSSARDYTFIHDTVSGIMSAWNYVKNNENVYEIINLGNKNPVQLKELIATLYEILEKTPNVIQTTMKPGDVNITFADISKAQKLLNYNPQTSLKDGLIAFVNWSKKN